MNVWVIATNTFREAVRNKVFYTLLFFATLFSGFSIILSTMVLGDPAHVLIDLGLANIEIFGTLIAIFVGITLVYKELQQRTIYTIITRPIRRHQFILGKTLGLTLTLVTEVAAMSLVFFLVLALWGGADRIADTLPAIWLAFMKLALITSVATFFSSFSTPILSGMFTLGFYLIGAGSGYLPDLVDPEKSPVLAAAIRLLNFVLPDFRLLDVKGRVVYGDPVPAGDVFTATVYALFYIALILVLAILIFDRKDIK